MHKKHKKKNTVFFPSPHLCVNLHLSISVHPCPSVVLLLAHPRLRVIPLFSQSDGVWLESFTDHVNRFVLRFVICAYLDFRQQPHADKMYPEEHQHK
jgi:hypothetical protein